MRYIFTFFLILHFFLQSSFAQITYNATINSIGYYIDVQAVSGLSNKFSTKVKFQIDTVNAIWRDALDPVIETIAGKKQIIGSLLQLDAGSSYTIKAIIYDSVSANTITLPSITATTMAEPVIPDVSNTLWVSPNGSGNLYSSSQPGRFETLFSTDYTKVVCGTKIICKGGLYNIGDLQYNTRTCSDLSQPIIIQSAPGEMAVFDGSDTAQSTRFPNWQVYDSENNIYKTTFPSTDAFSTLLRYDGVRLFPYSGLAEETISGLTYKDVLKNCSTSFGSGFYRDKSGFYIKLANNDVPNKEIIVSKYVRLLRIDVGQSNTKFIFNDITVKNYGKPDIVYYKYFIPNPNCNCFFNPNCTCFIEVADSNTILDYYDAKAFEFRGIKNVFYNNCIFEYNTISVFFQTQSDVNCDNIIIQNCTFTDNSGLWNHSAYKNSALSNSFSFTESNLSGSNSPGKYGRNLQASAVAFNYGATSLKNIIVRNNTFEGLVATLGIKGSGNNPLPAYDVDFDSNTINNCYNAMGNAEISCNSRAWGNKLSNCLAGYSTIAVHGNPNIGPVYIFRNIFGKMIDRTTIIRNDALNFPPNFYVHYYSCQTTAYKNWATALKLDGGTSHINNNLDIFFIHNTVFARDSFAFSFYIGSRNLRTLTSINNIYYSNFNAAKFENIANEKDYYYKSTRDNYFSKFGASGIVSIGANWTSCITTNRADSLDAILRRITGNNNTDMLQIKEGFDAYPAFTDTANNNYILANGSPLIDTGIKVPNISDVLGINYFCKAPEIGAIENKDCIIVLPVPLLSLTADPIENKFIRINWKVAQEINLKDYVLERSEDGIHYHKIAIILPSSSQSYEKYYAYDDFDVQPNVYYYYRLRMEDNDETYKYSHIVSAKLIKNASIEIIAKPNPFQSEIQLQTSGIEPDSPFFLKVFNSLGNEIYNNEYKGSGLFLINTALWSNGFYTLIIDTENRNRKSIKLVKM